MSKQSISSTLRDDHMVFYQPWREDAFQTDIYVRHMPAVARWMYRTLRQAAFACEEAPYLPNDDDQLWMLAGCESKTQWMEYAASVRARFTPVVIEGKSLLSHPTELKDWERIEHHYAQRRESGRKGGLARARNAKAQAQAEFDGDEDLSIAQVTHKEGSTKENKEKKTETSSSKARRSFPA